MEQMRALEPAEQDRLVARLQQDLITFAYCQADNPFQDRGNEVLFEEFSVWRRGFFEKMGRVLQAKSQSYYFAVPYHSEDGKTVAFDPGYCVTANMDYDTYKHLSHEIGFSINGLEFYLFDRTFSWCIGTTVDIQFVTGDAAFLQAYYSSPDEKQASAESFLEQIAPEDIYPGFKKMRTYVRY